MTLKAVALLVSLAIIGAGCVGGGPRESTNNSDGAPARTSGQADGTGANRTVPFGNGTSNFIDLVDCAYFPISFQVPQTLLDDTTPPAYEPVGSAPGLAQMNLMLLECDHVNISNQTAANEVTLATLIIQVEPPAPVKPDADLHFYRLESHVSDEAVVAALAGHGAPVTLGSTSWSRGEATFDAVVEAKGSVVYEIRGTYGLESAPVQDRILREHYQVLDDSFAWIDVQQRSQAAAWPGPFTLTAKAGLLAQTQPYAVGLVSEGTYSATLTFHTKTKDVPP